MIKIFITLCTLISYVHAHDFINFADKNIEVIKYRKIKPNITELKKDSLTIIVDKSAGSVLIPFKKAKKVNKIEVSGNVLGKINPSAVAQGQKGADDFVLRFGIVYEENETLGFFARKFAPNWVLKIFNKAPKGAGISHIDLRNIIEDKKNLGNKRIHPSTKYMIERFDHLREENGDFNLLLKPEDKKIVAIWICSDGDETKSQFKLRIDKIKLSEN